MKNLTDLFCKYEDQDIYVITGGPSLNYIDKSFFEGKVVIGVNDIFRYFRCDYVVVKDCMEEPRFPRLTEELKEKDIPLIYSEYHKGHRSEGLNEIDNPNSYMFKHNPREEGRDFIDEISELEGDEILVSRSTITSAIHLSAYMGAKNIILCGHDGGEIDGEQYYKGYVKEDWKSASNWSGLKDFLVKAEQETMILKEVLKNQGIVVCSLNPFINLRLEGNKFDTYTISEYKV